MWNGYLIITPRLFKCDKVEILFKFLLIIYLGTFHKRKVGWLSQISPSLEAARLVFRIISWL